MIGRMKIIALIPMFFTKRFFLFVIVLHGAVSLFAQPNKSSAEPVKLTFYYNQNWELTSPEKSLFKREAYFDLRDMVFDGIYKDYKNEDKLIAEGYYAHGVKSGIETEYFDDKSIKSTVEFSGDDFIIWQLMNDKKEYEIIKGNGKFTTSFYYFFDYYLKRGTLTGEFQNGKKSGNWIYYDARNVKTDVELYQRGKLLKRTYYTKTDSMTLLSKKETVLSVVSILTEGLSFDKESFTSASQYFETHAPYPASFQRNVSYPGGINHVLQLLSQQADVPDRNLVLVKVKLNEHGQVLKTGIVRSVDSNTDDRVEEAIKLHAARFFPAVKDGKPYATTIYLPVSRGEEWQKMLQEMPTEWFLDVSNFY